MTEEIIYDLKIALLNGGDVELSQNIGCGETTTVTLHRIHLRYLFEQLGHIKPTEPDALARRFAHELYDTLDELRKCRIDEDRQMDLLTRLCWFVNEFVWPTGLLDDHVDDEAKVEPNDESSSLAKQGALL